MPVSTLPSDQRSRRALLITPIAFAGLAALWYPRERKLLDPAQNGSGPEVQLALFSNSGECRGFSAFANLSSPMPNGAQILRPNNTLSRGAVGPSSPSLTDTGTITNPVCTAASVVERHSSDGRTNSIPEPAGRAFQLRLQKKTLVRELTRVFLYIGLKCCAGNVTRIWATSSTTVHRPQDCASA